VIVVGVWGGGVGGVVGCDVGGEEEVVDFVPGEAVCGTTVRATELPPIDASDGLHVHGSPGV